MFTSLRNQLNPVFYSGGGSSAGAWSEKSPTQGIEARGATQFNLDSSSLDVCSCTYFVVASSCAQYFVHEQQIWLVLSKLWWQNSRNSPNTIRKPKYKISVKFYMVVGINNQYFINIIFHSLIYVIRNTPVRIMLWCPMTKMFINSCFLIQPLEEEGGCQ